MYRNDNPGIENGTFPERLILESGGKHYSGQASIIFSNVDDGLLLDKFSFSYDLDCYETEASTLLNDSVVNYNIVIAMECSSALI